jgi:hypothetical protein
MRTPKIMSALLRDKIPKDLCRIFGRYGYKEFYDLCSSIDDYSDGPPIKLAPQGTFPREEQVLVLFSSEYSYNGRAYLLWEDDDGKLREDELSHCSCNAYRDHEFGRLASVVTVDYLRRRQQPSAIIDLETSTEDYDATPEDARLVLWDWILDNAR